MSAAALRPAAMHLTTRLAPVAASPAMNTFSGYGRMFRFQESHRQKHHVCLYRLFPAGRFHHRPSCPGFRLPLDFLHFRTCHLAVLSDESESGQAPSPGAPFFMAAARLQDQRPLRPRCRRILSHRRLRHYLYLCHARGPPA